MVKNVNKRHSGIELLKILSIFLIVLSHSIQTLSESNETWTIDLSIGSTNISYIILMIFRYSGVLGNTIFFICSAWFLVDKQRTNYEKLIRIVVDAFIISIMWLVPIAIWKQGKIGTKLWISSFFPIYMNNNWYVTSYILFCLIFPFLNLIIRHINRRTHLIISVVLFALCFCLSFIYPYPWMSVFSVWITIYFAISYFKIYSVHICDSAKANIIFVLIGLFLHVFLIVGTNFINYRFGILSPLRWNNKYNPLLFLVGFGFFNLFKKMKFYSKPINYISSMSLLVYIIHENILFRTYIRPMAWGYIFEFFGSTNVLLLVLIYSLSLFIVSLFGSLIYSNSISYFTRFISSKFTALISKIIPSINERTS